jgi:16S rRNA processing protein RimM
LSGVAATGWVAIATVLRPQGRRGELLSEPLSDLPEVFAAGQSVVLAAPGTVPPSGAAKRTLEAHWFPTGRNAGRVVLQVSGCTSIHEAEQLVGLQVMVPAAALPVLDADTFFVGHLVGCIFYDGARCIGQIVDVEFATGPDGRTRLEEAAPLLAVSLGDGVEPSLIPFVKAWLKRVDLAGRRIVMELPEGLLEAATDEESGEAALD